MNDALYIAATGMQAQQSQLDVIANNVANVNTSGYKRGTVSFADMIQRAATAPAFTTGRTAREHDDFGTEPTSASLPAGVTVSSSQRQFDNGPLTQTSSPLDLAVEGDGFLEVQMSDGSVGFSRGGTLKLGTDNMLSVTSGEALKQRIQIPADAHGITIASDGTVTVTDDKSSTRAVGRIQLVTFANSSGLQPLGDNLYRQTNDSGEPMDANANEAGAGKLMQGYLEQSNVKLVDEMVQLMVAQRAYEMNVKVVQAADQIASMTNGLLK